MYLLLSSVLLKLWTIPNVTNPVDASEWPLEGGKDSKFNMLHGPYLLAQLISLS